MVEIRPTGDPYTMAANELPTNCAMVHGFIIRKE